MSFGPAPPFKYLSNEKCRALLTTLREKTAPILANNLLPHFPDHSVAHSDNVTELIDALLENGNNTLTNQELMILYSACYLHDIGMQFERANETKVISSLNLVPPWNERSESDKHDLLREYHNEISAELVQRSVHSAEPPIGLQLTHEFNPSYIASICQAHGLQTDSPEYTALVNDGPNIRMSLLSGLLRLADILDESRRRATREKARTLELDLESQAHWWRHYYTEDVNFDGTNRMVTIWFDFPSDRLTEYKQIVPLLQMPQIEAEFQRHEQVLLKNGVGWSVQQKSRSKSHSDVEEMPEEVLTEMLKQLVSCRRAADEEHRLLTFGQFREARPSIDRRLKTLKDREPSIEKGEYLLELSRVSFDLFELGGCRSARSALFGRYLSDLHHLPLDDRIRIGITLLEWLVDDGQCFEAGQLLEKLAPEAQTLPRSDNRKWQYTLLEIRVLNAACAYNEAISAIENALKWAPEGEKASLNAEMAEMELLQGDFGQDGEA